MAPHSKKCPRGFLCAGDCNEVAEEPQRAVLERVDLLIIHKFGKEEAHGRRLRPVIAQALIAEIFQLIGVSTRNLCDFLNLVGDLATHLTPDVGQLRPGAGTRLSAGLTIDASRGCHPGKHRGE
jgi:hypothetical protein